MKVDDVVLWLQEHDLDDSVGVIVSFPQVDGWEVASWDVYPTEEEGLPCLMVSVYGADFDYPGPERALAREARAFLGRREAGLGDPG